MLDIRNVNTTLSVPSECRLCPRSHSGKTAETSRRKLVSNLQIKFKKYVVLYWKKKPVNVAGKHDISLPNSTCGEVSPRSDSRADIRFRIRGAQHPGKWGFLI